MKNDVEIAIIGAGPYGLSLATHLRARKASYRIFGSPMYTWINQMPEGMFLKSEGLASTLYDPDSAFTLEHYCKRNSIPYADVGIPVRLDTFTEYGLEFQRKMVPELEQKMVVALDRSEKGFRLQLDDGEIFGAAKVVIAVGISHFEYMPEILKGVPSKQITHSSQHSRLDEFRGRDVTVIGGGSSALDTAALLHKAGASTRVIVRKPLVHFHAPPGPTPRPLWDRLKAPMSLLGPGWRSMLCVKAPLLFYPLPRALRLEIVKKHLGPATAWYMKDAIVGKVDLNLGTKLTGVRVHNEKVHLDVVGSDGQARRIETDHVIAGTGYAVDLRRLSFISDDLRRQIRTAGPAPILSTSFQSSVKDLYFTGAAAAPSFGPLLRFACGAKFTARRLSRHLVKSGVTATSRAQAREFAS